MSARRGHILSELIVALALGAVICGALAGALSGGQRLTRHQAAVVAGAEALRIAGAVVGGELRFLDPAADIRALTGDSLAVRALRGVAIVCAADGGRLAARFRGLRAPDPAKDSVLVLDATGRGRPVGLLGGDRADDACETRDGESVYRLTLDGASAPRGSLLLLFETGSYHLADRALRYRRGAGGRQPITAEVLDIRRSAFRQLRTGAASGLSAIEVTLVVRPPASGAGAAEAPPRSARFRFPLLNADTPVEGDP